jgi:membrane-associated phospholipid phosphatase
VRTTSSAEHELIAYRRRDFLTTVVLLAVAAALSTLIWFDGSRSLVQRVDDAFLRVAVEARSTPLTVIAHVFNVLGLVWVTLPVRAAVAIYLGVKRRWWHFAAFLGSMVASEALIGPLKLLFDRARPPTPLVEVSSGSFPSGHAVAASVTTVALVIALVPSGPRRWAWGVGAASFSFVMAVSRVYLGAHWLSDALAGVLIGTAVALGVAVVLQAVWDGRAGPAGDADWPRLTPDERQSEPGTASSTRS